MRSGRRALLTLLVTVAMACASPAEEVLIKLHVEPPEATVTIDGQNPRPTTAPFMLALPAGAEPLSFTLEAEGYQPMTVQLTPDELRKTRRLPAQGTYQLQKPFSLAYLIPVALVLAGGGVWVARRRSRAPLEPPAPQAPYTTEGVLAEGGMAVVYKGTCPKAPGRKVAIKVVRPELLEDQDAKKRFLREMEICARLDHPHLVRLYDSGVGLNQEMYLVMELLEGKSLADEIYDAPHLPSKERIAEILLPLCQALEHIHDKGLVHRDVKPSNVFLDRNSGVKLVDLGIARGLDFEAVTRTGIAVGSPHYMAPEQAKGDVRPENDQYSVGVLLFEMLTGSRPYPQGDPIAVITQHLTAPIPSVLDRRPDAGGLVDTVVQRLMSKRPEGRFASIREAASAIEAALMDTGGGDDATCGVYIPR